jgi:hypothetical protein
MPRAMYRQSAASHQVNSVQIFRVFLHGLFIRIKESCAQGSCSQVGAVWVRKQRLLPHIRKTTAASSEIRKTTAGFWVQLAQSSMLR